MTDTPPRRRRRTDPDRRDRLIDATRRVLAEHGLEGLSARAIAAEADVPLSAATYHFKSLDNLLEAALVETLKNDVEAMRDTLAGIPSDGDVIAAIAGYLAEFMQDGSGFSVTAQLWVAAARREGLKAQALRWYDEWCDVLASRIDPLGARVVAAVILGTNQRELASTEHPTATDLEELLRRAVR